MSAFGPMLAAGLLGCLLTVAAQAPEETVTLDRMVEINRRALAELERGEADAARDSLLDAVVIGKQAGLGAHQMMARTYLHLGAVYLTGLRDRARALRQLVLALKIRPEIQITPQLATAELQELFEEARVEAGLAAPADPAPAPPAEAAAPPAPRAADEAPAAVEAPPAPPASSALGRGPRGFWVALGVGSGLGLHPRRDLEFERGFERGPGLAAAALAQLTPEVGYQLHERLAVSIQYRWQGIPTSGSTERQPDERPGAAHAVLVRAHRALGAVGPAQLWGTATAGIGSAFRLRVPAGGELPGSDTIDGGPFALGPGAALLYPVGDRLAIGAEARALLGLWRTALLAEVSLGAAYAF